MPKKTLVCLVFISDKVLFNEAKNRGLFPLIVLEASKHPWKYRSDAYYYHNYLVLAI